MKKIKKQAMHKRVFGAVLSIMLLTSQSSFAVENDSLQATKDEAYKSVFTDVSGEECEDAATRLYQLGILSGYEDGSFRGDNILTRAEFVTAVTKLVSPVKEIKLPENTVTEFSDVPKEHWAYRAVCVGAEKNLVAGYSDGCFYPSLPVTYNQAVKILVCAAGYKEDAEKRGGYPYGYLLEASERGITKNLTADFENGVSRATAAIMMSNSLDVVHKSEERTLEQIKTGNYATFYVSPNGSDNNPGTEEKPWKTIYKAIKNVKAGCTLILEDGEYYEEHVTLMRASGTEEAPIVIKARNKHKAKIIYGQETKCNTRFELSGASYTTVQDIAFTTVVRATSSDLAPTADILFHMINGEHNTIRGNSFSGVFEDGLKFTYMKNCTIEDNLIFDIGHEGIDSVNNADNVIRNNELREIGRAGIMLKGGTRDCEVYNNFIYISKTDNPIAGITVGGSTNSINPYSIQKDVAYELYNTQIYNNIIYSPNRNLRWGMAFYASNNCRVFNNVVSGMSVSAFLFSPSNGKTNGWEWDPPIKDNYVYNNIFDNCAEMYIYQVDPINFVSDYNLYNNVGNAPEEEHSVYKNPEFIDESNGDFRLKSSSPAIGAGIAVPSEFTGMENVIKNIDTADPDGVARTDKWNIGAY